MAQKILAKIKENEDSIRISVDLNKSIRAFRIENNHLILDKKNKLGIKKLQRIIKKDKKIFVLQNGFIKPLEYRINGYYKLVPTDYAPTVEINGIKMHKSKDCDPFIDAKLKVKEVVKNGHHVLDTCSGLGYTAIWAMRLGATKVVSVEIDKFIQELRKENPWSIELQNKRIELVYADVLLYIEEFKKGSFDSIIHDPPRFPLAGELYGTHFYSELYRILKKRGKLFHYTGNPYKVRRGNTFYINTIKRLKSVGFSTVVPKQQLLGVLASKR
jgi:predicted methyltransferase